MKRLNLSKLEFQDSFNHKKSVLFGTQDFDSNTKVQILSLKPSQTIPPHLHNTRTEAFYIISGEGQVIINDEVVVSGADDIALCQPGDIHSMINSSSTEEFKLLVIRTNDPGDNDMIWVKE
jgi:quercetin dioxygenase-like cupin family protein